MSRFKKYLNIIQEMDDNKLYISKKQQQEKPPEWYFQFLPKLSKGTDISSLDTASSSKYEFFKMEYDKNKKNVPNKSFGDLTIDINPEIGDKGKNAIMKEINKYFDQDYWSYSFEPKLSIDAIKKLLSFKGYGDITDFKVIKPIKIEQGNSPLTIGKVIKGKVLFTHSGVKK